MPAEPTPHQRAALSIVYNHLTGDGAMPPQEALAEIEQLGLADMLVEFDGMLCCMELDPDSSDFEDELAVKREVLNLDTWRTAEERLRQEAASGAQAPAGLARWRRVMPN